MVGPSSRFGYIPLSAYIHWPWCIQKCPYCDFNSHASPVQEDRYVAALIEDFRRNWLPLYDGRELQSIFFGGGTPSLMRPDSVKRLIEMLKNEWGAEDGLEVTLEVNPGAQDNAKLKAFAEAGVTRASIGVQSFDPQQLKTLGRIHTVDQAVQAVKLAKRYFDEVNVDMMYGLPGQSAKDLELDLEQAIKLKPTHLSVYQLTLEEGTYFGKHPPAQMPDDDLSADLTDVVEDMLSDYGFNHYEVSAWAKTWHYCQHNLNYWKFGDYLALGAGAHSKFTANDTITRVARFNSPEKYMQAVQAGLAFETREVSADELPFEFMLNALRLVNQIVPWDFIHRRTGLEKEKVLAVLEPFAKRDLVLLSPLGFELTKLGQRHVTELQMAFLDI